LIRAFGEQRRPRPRQARECASRLLAWAGATRCAFVRPKQLRRRQRAVARPKRERSSTGGEIKWPRPDAGRVL